ncbi:hypothetical protein LY76DRAFT_325607 [Colletotrichum caudatum]|nr:hypothetical protein LY76DRAFT_325607 [Colletotrichum caudatum]
MGICYCVERWAWYLYYGFQTVSISLYTYATSRGTALTTCPGVNIDKLVVRVGLARQAANDPVRYNEQTSTQTSESFVNERDMIRHEIV